MAKYSRKDKNTPEYRVAMGSFLAVAKEAFECEEGLKEMFEI